MPRRQFVMAALAAATVMTGVSLAPPVRTATHEYVIAEAELREAMAPATVEWRTFSARYPAADGYFTFSAVGFSPDRAMAVVYVEHFCTPLCGSGRVEFLRKRHGRWRAAEVRGVRTCGWIS